MKRLGRNRSRGSRRRDPLAPIFKRLDKGVKKGIITQEEADGRKAHLTLLQAEELIRRDLETWR